MEFIFETDYNQKALTTMAKVMRKTIRKKRSRRSHILGWIILVCALLFSLPFGNENYVIDKRTIINWLVALAIIMVFLFEDKLNGYIARKRMLSGTETAKTVFNEEGYTSSTKIGKSDFYYNSINLIAETHDYFVFIFDQSHAQVYDKNRISGGTVEELRDFISEVTGKEVKRMKY